MQSLFHIKPCKIGRRFGLFFSLFQFIKSQFEMTGYGVVLPVGQQSTKKVAAQIQRSQQPAFHSIRVIWDAPLVFQAPNEIFSLFSGQIQIVYALIGKFEKNFICLRKYVCRFSSHTSKYCGRI